MLRNTVGPLLEPTAAVMRYLVPLRSLHVWRSREIQWRVLGAFLAWLSFAYPVRLRHRHVWR
jgi:hypothetical protein